MLAGKEGISQGLKPPIFSLLDVRAEARTYLRSKNNGNAAKQRQRSENNGNDSTPRRVFKEELRVVRLVFGFDHYKIDATVQPAAFGGCVVGDGAILAIACNGDV